MGSLLKSTRNTRQLPVGNLRYLRSDCPDDTGGGSVPASPEAVANSYVKMVDAQMVEIVDTIMSAKTNVLFL